MFTKSGKSNSLSQMPSVIEALGLCMNVVATDEMGIYLVCLNVKIHERFLRRGTFLGLENHLFENVTQSSKTYSKRPLVNPP